MRLTEEEIRERAKASCQGLFGILTSSRYVPEMEKRVADALRSALVADRLPHPQADVEARLREIERYAQDALTCTPGSPRFEESAGWVASQAAWLLAIVRDQAAFIHDLREESLAYQCGVEDERMACARIADTWRGNLDAPRDQRAHEWAASAQWIAEAIRARSSQPESSLPTP